LYYYIKADNIIVLLRWSIKLKTGLRVVLLRGQRDRSITKGLTKN